MTLPHSTVLSSRTCLSTQLAVFHDGLADPVDARITTDCFVHGVDHDDFVIQVCGVLTNPIGAEHTESTSQTSCSLLCFRSSTPLKFDLVDTFTLGFTVCCSLGNRLLTSSTSQTNTVNHVPLFGTVTESSRSVRSRGTGCSVDGGEVTKLPTSDPEEKAKKIALFLLVEFLEIFI